MIKKILIASLAAGALAFGAPAAHADHIQFDCGFDTIAQEDVTGGQDTFTGVAYGFAASSTPGESVEIVCYVEVDGSPATSTAGDGPGTQVDTYSQQVTYTATDTQDVDLCADVYVWVNGTRVLHAHVCFETTTTQIPPQEVIDLLILITSIPDPLLCPELVKLQNSDVPPLIDIRSDGDLYILGEWIWDCPVYGESGT